MTERIDVPTDGGTVSKCLLKELLALHHVVDHVVKVRAGLIMHRPTAVYKLNLPVSDHLADAILRLLLLAFPPHREELHLNEGELLARVGLKSLHYGRDDLVD